MFKFEALNLPINWKRNGTAAKSWIKLFNQSASVLYESVQYVPKLVTTKTVTKALYVPGLVKALRKHTTRSLR